MIENINKKSVNILVVATSKRFAAWLQPFNAVAQGNITTVASEGVRYHFTQSSNLDKALKLLPMLRSDVIIIDCGDRRDIEEFIGKVRKFEKDRHSGIVVCSSLSYDDKEAVGVLNAGADEYVSREISSCEIMARIRSIFRTKSAADELRRANYKLERLSLTDELTGLHNMRSFEAEFEQLMTRTRQGSLKGLGVLMLDLDHFKFVNDSSNHLVGSYVISEVGRLIRESNVLPKGSVPARFGGDEYVIACPVDSFSALKVISKKLKDLIAKTVFRKDGFVIQVSTCIGFCWVAEGFKGAKDSPIKTADLMLYQSKRCGRNLATGESLGNTVDLDHVGRPHLVDGQTGGNHHRISRIHNV